ncbi:MAG: hypothetical protein NVS4B13_02710 [Candidatus Elarobacter sp.]
MTFGGDSMAFRLRLSLSVLAALALAACGGGGSGGGSSIAPGPAPTPGPGSVTIAPASLSFSGPGTPAQTFTISSSFTNLPPPAVNSLGCGSVATFATASTSLPATYTVSPTGNGSCALVVKVGSQAAALGITVGGGAGPALSQTTNAITVFVGGTPGSVTVTASSGTLTPDGSACAGIAAVGGSAGPSPQTYTIAPLAPGNCTLVVVDGASTVLVPITVNANPGGTNALFITPSAMTFASPLDAAQQANLTFSGNVGQVTINQDDCIGNTGKTKIAYLQLTGTAPGTPVSLPQNVTITPYPNRAASGTSCSIFFTSSVGASQAVLTIVVR